jgi:hypothetical protein
LSGEEEEGEEEEEAEEDGWLLDQVATSSHLVKKATSTLNDLNILLYSRRAF